LVRKAYDFKPDGPLAEIKQHSIAKHEVLRTYVVEYIKTLVTSPRRDELRLTLVDGFAGGGVYLHETTKEIVVGSPLVLLDAVEEAQAVLSTARIKPLQMKVDYVFVDIDPLAHALLTKTLRAYGHGHRIGKDIQLVHSSFEDEAPRIKDFVKDKSPRNGRSIFFLDQYGYSQVPVRLIRSIFRELPAAEVILTFHVGSFLTYANDDNAKILLQQMDAPDALKGRSIEDIKNNEKDFRFFIQSLLYPALVKACGAGFYTLFFIRTDGHGDYWLVHLSQHHRARDVMTRVHWAKNNYFIHYGGPGIDMFHVLGYDPAFDDQISGQGALNFGFEFDDIASKKSADMLMEQLPRLIFSNEGGISFGQLFATTCNTSPADSDKYREALARLVALKEIEIQSPDGRRRLRASTITDKDQLLPSRQARIIF
jgi:three-Cys-motif partner protein